MTIDISLWPHVKARRPLQRQWSWDILVKALTLARDRTKEKTELPLWSPTFYPPHTTRGSENVAHLSCLVLDYDAGLSIDEGWEVWKDYRSLLHVSFNHHAETPKYRIVLPFAVPIPRANWSAVWRWAEIQTLKNIDEKCKDPGRCYFLSCLTEDPVDYTWKVREGKVLDLSHIRPLPKADYRAISAAYHRQDGPRYSVDPTARLDLGLTLGGKRGGQSVKDIPCPQCGRNSVWWPISPEKFTGWKCKHQNSCGASGSLSQLVK